MNFTVSNLVVKGVGPFTCNEQCGNQDLRDDLCYFRETQSQSI